jgi:amino acid transporter
MNLPAVLILAVVTFILVIGIRESAASNTALVVLKLSVVLFVIIVGAAYVNPSNWNTIPPEDRKLVEEQLLPENAEALARIEERLTSAARELSQFETGKVAKRVTVDIPGDRQESLTVPEESDLKARTKALTAQTLAYYKLERNKQVDGELLRAGRITKEQATAREAEVKERVEKMLKEADTHLPTGQTHAIAQVIASQGFVSPGIVPQASVALGVALFDTFALHVPASADEIARVKAVIAKAREKAPEKAAEKWGMIGEVGLNKSLVTVDDSVRSSFLPYGFSGMMLGAALVFFAFIGFDSISTHAEEAVRPQRDVPIGILASLFLCTALYVAVAAIITGMKPFPDIDPSAAVASAFRERAEESGGSWVLSFAGGLIAAGALAGMTSVLLITFLSQARIFLAMARDRLMPPAVFGAVHERFRTPHISTMLTGAVMCVVAAFTPITTLEEMVNIGTLFAFVVVCAAVLILRIRRPEAHRPFRCPAVFVVAPLGILVNLTLMLFLPPLTWMRLFVWLLVGLVIYFGYSYFHSALGKQIESTGAPLM